MYKFNPEKTTEMAKELFKEERAINHLEGWFIIKEEEQKAEEKYKNLELISTCIFLCSHLLTTNQSL